MRSELLLGAGPRVPIDPPGVGSPPGASGPTCVLITGVLRSAVPGAEGRRTGSESPQRRKRGVRSPRGSHPRGSTELLPPRRQVRAALAFRPLAPAVPRSDGTAAAGTTESGPESGPKAESGAVRG